MPKRNLISSYFGAGGDSVASRDRSRPRARAGGAGAPSPRRTAAGSAFAGCPVCGLHVALPLLDGHLDRCLTGEPQGRELAVAQPEAAAGAPPESVTPAGAPSRSTTSSGGEVAPSSSDGKPAPVPAPLRLRPPPPPRAWLVGGPNLLAAELAAACPVVQLVRGVLPPGLADALLLELVAAAPRWPQSEWWVQGARHIAARRTVVYPLPAQAELPRGNGERPEPEYKQSAADPPPSLCKSWYCTEPGTL